MLDECTANGVSLAVVRRAQTGDLAAFGELVHPCRRWTIGIVRCLISRPEDVDDVAQKVPFRMHTSTAPLRTPESFDFWFYRLTVNGAYDYLRKRPRHRDVLMADLEERVADLATASASWQLLRDERDRLRTIDHMDSLLARLAPPDRILIVMREAEGLTMEEPSALCGIRARAVKTRLFRAGNRLRQVLNSPAGNAAAAAATHMVLAAENT